MKVITISAQITRNPKQFEAIRLGMEASIDASENPDEAIKALTARLNALYEEMYCTPKKAAQTEEKAPQQTAGEEPKEKELLKVGDRRLQQIVGRIEKAGNAKELKELLVNVKKYYRLDEGAQKAVDMAVALNN